MLFLACSGLAWFVGKLSETYTHGSMFDVTYENEPDSLSLIGASADKVPVRLTGKGFQFLGLALKPRKVVLDLSKVQKEGTRFYLSNHESRRQIQGQLPGSMTLLELGPGTIHFDFYVMETKKVPVIPMVHLAPAQNYMIEGKMDIGPSEITVHGPKEEIDTILAMWTRKVNLSGLTSDFKESVPLELPKGLKNTTFSQDRVTVQGKVSRFSEKLIEVPVTVTNLPSGYGIRTFPDKVALLCRSRIEDLIKMESTDFMVVADYSTLKEGSYVLDLTVQRSPQSLNQAILQQTQVEFILKIE